MKILSNLPPFYRGIPNIVIKYRVKSDDPKSNSNSTIMFVIPRVFCINISLPELEKNTKIFICLYCVVDIFTYCLQYLFVVQQKATNSHIMYLFIYYYTDP